MGSHSLVFNYFSDRFLTYNQVVIKFSYVECVNCMPYYHKKAIFPGLSLKIATIVL